jgi:hypothetical protein
MPDYDYDFSEDETNDALYFADVEEDGDDEEAVEDTDERDYNDLIGEGLR